MSLGTGEHIGPYEVVAAIGAGGMGEVYRARDPRLGREVAIKISGARFTDRFEREARAIAALNHPNVCTLYDVGPNYLVMEVVEGQTLQGPLPLDVALNYARQIADALEAAHEKGIVHRDLKPANIKINRAGTVKVLDFGLATIAREAAPDGSTLTVSASSPGTIVGTAAYMAPEQARGMSVDQRADIWAFGVVLFEMLTGTQAFRGQTMTDILASVVKDQPDLSALPPQVSPIIARCLSKEPRTRWASIGDVRWALDELKKPADLPTQAVRRRHLPWLAAAAILLSLAAVGAWFWRTNPSQPLLQMEITAPKGTRFGPVGLGQLALSPDGRRLVAIATGTDGKRRLWLRSLDGVVATALAGTEDVSLYPFWSPDSRWVGFSANGKLQKIDVIAGGPPQVICECATAYATWNPAETILFGTRDEPIQRVPASGGSPTPVFGFYTVNQETREGGPCFLPDGRHFVYGSFGTKKGSVLASLDGKTRRFLFETRESPAIYAPNPAGGGWLLYVDNGQLFARPFEPGKGQLAGAAAFVADAVAGGPSWSTSANGILAFRHTHPNQSQLTWFQRDGTLLNTIVESGNLSYPRISPDQKTVAFVQTERRNSDIWLFDIARKTSTRFTSDPGEDNYPAWSFDSSRIVYSSTRQNQRLLIERSANGAGAETILIKKSEDLKAQYYNLPLLSMLPTGLTPSGRWIVATETFAGLNIVWLLPRLRDSESIRFTTGADGTVSPDGRWLLYASSVTHPDVFVQPMPSQAGGSTSGAGRWQISTAGGGNPVWRGDGKEIFYLASDGKMMAVPVDAGENFFRPGTPKALFQTRLMPSNFREYDVTSDGKRFLLNLLLADSSDEPITVIVNWPKLLEK